VPQLKVSLIHLKVRPQLQSNLDAAEAGICKAATQHPAFIALPEYFSIPNNMEQFYSAKDISAETSKPTWDFLQYISREIGDIYLMGGTALEEDNGKFYNVSTLWLKGKLVGKYRKRNPIKAEIEAGITPGDQPLVLNTQHCKVGMLVCADMFSCPTIKAVADLGAELVFLPVAAMGSHPTVSGHPLTFRLAAENGIYLVKIGNVSSNSRGGRSAFITPWGVEQEVSDALEDSVLTKDFDIAKLREYRRQIGKA
jgi:predicted amidohydrolase